MQRNGSVNLVCLDIHTGVNDEVHDLERFGFNDGGCSSVLQACAQWRKIEYLSGACAVHGHLL